MAKLSENYELGNIEDLSLPEFARRMQEMYTDLARAINSKPDLVFITSDGDGTPSDGAGTETFLSNGTININTDTNKVQMLTNHTSTSAVTWTTLS